MDHLLSRVYEVLSHNGTSGENGEGRLFSFERLNEKGLIAQVVRAYP